MLKTHNSKEKTRGFKNWALITTKLLCTRIMSNEMSNREKTMRSTCVYTKLMFDNACVLISPLVGLISFRFFDFILHTRSYWCGKNSRLWSHTCVRHSFVVILSGWDTYEQINTIMHNRISTKYSARTQKKTWQNRQKRKWKIKLNNEIYTMN